MPNRLAQAASLYLRKHADNPIDWWPWSDEAIAKARLEDKPILLSVGYSSCHWCTVMEGEAFSDVAIAAYLNEQFVAIKVDREERPDIDSIYMQTLQMMAGSGGWPMNMVLSPEDLVPFYGGTYFPVEPRYGRPGFLQVLQALRGFYDAQKQELGQGKLGQVKQEILTALQQLATAQRSPRAAGEGAGEPEVSPPAVALSVALLAQGLEYSARIIEPNPQGNSFPMIPYALAALRGTRWRSPLGAIAQTACLQRGVDLALGGIYDHVAGGFHRYTVDPTWTVPHFEKMLYDNGQIVEFLANLWAAGAEEPAFETAIAGTVAWLRREMQAPEGYFYAAQDADSFGAPQDAEPEEGAFYVWDEAELSALLDEAERNALGQDFAISPGGNFEGKTVLQRTQRAVLGPTTQQALNRLFLARYGTAPEQTPTFPPARNNTEAKTQSWPGRIPAVTDTKLIVAWNSLMISGLARAAVVFDQPDYYTLASQVATFILEQQSVGGRLHRLNYDGQAAVIAQSEDYACLIKALLDLQQASLCFPAELTTVDWLRAAQTLQAEFDQHLWSADLGGYYNTDARPDLLIRERSYDDNAKPSANGVAIANLVWLALLTDDLTFMDRAEQALQAFSAIMATTPQTCPSLFSALDDFYHALQIRTSPDLIHDLAGSYLPTATFKRDTALPEGVVGLVCQGFTCREPAQTFEQMVGQITQYTNPSK